MMIRERQKKEKKNIGAFAVIGACVVGMLAFIMNMALADKVNELDKNGCIGSGEAGSAILIDYSPPLFNDVQRRGLAQYFASLYQDRALGNERIVVYGFQGSDWATIPRETLSICKPVRTAEEAKRYGGPEASDQWLKNRDKKVFDRLYWPEIERLLNTKAGSTDATRDSPIIEMLQSASRMADMTGRPLKRIVLVSDLIQNSDGLQWCYKSEQKVPAYNTFAKSVHGRRLHPSPFTGVEVEVLQLGRESQALHCSPEELEGFFREYVLKNGGQGFRAIRLREGI